MNNLEQKIRNYDKSFNLLKRFVKYVKNIKGDKQISHSMTTSLVLMTESDILQYSKNLTDHD